MLCAFPLKMIKTCLMYVKKLFIAIGKTIFSDVIAIFMFFINKTIIRKATQSSFRFMQSSQCTINCLIKNNRLPTILITNLMTSNWYW